ncbi:MAG: hypothetical protein K5866_00170 [Treponema sp.]|nr:hypothetical protein [Treponema sp.]
MKKKTKSKFKLHDLLFSLLCIGISAFFIFLFWKDLNLSSTRNDINQIASISFKHKIAQRKFSDRVVWERLQQHSPLYNNDTIRTADLSDARITFIDQTNLELHENTMIQISYSDKKGLKLSVGGGDVIIDASKSDHNVELNFANGSVNLAAGSKMSAKSDSESGEANFQIHSGSGSVINEDGSSQLIESGQSAKIFSDGKMKKGGITVTSISSDVRVLNFEGEPVPVHLEWNASEELAEAEIIIETSRSKDFSTIEKTYTSVGSSQLDLPADDGVLYWRIYAKEDKDEPVEGKVRVEEVSPISVMSPTNGAIFKYRSQLPKINFRWEGNDYADHYKIEVSDSIDFEEKLYDQDISTENLNINEFARGNYYWRVVPYYNVNEIGYGDTSPVMQFSVEQKEKAEAPELTVPADGETLLYTNQDFESLFLWKSEIDKAEYELIISKDSDFNQVIFTDKTDSKRVLEKFNTELFADGDYYWKVVRNSEEENQASQSQVHKFTVAKYIPEKTRLLYPLNDYSIEVEKLPLLEFLWRFGDQQKYSENDCVLQLSKSKDFTTDVKEFKTKKNQMKNLKTQEGTYYWRVGLFDIVSQEYNYTDSRTLNILGPLDLAQITYPAKDETLILGENSSINIKWNPVYGADYYSVKVLDDQNRVIWEEPEVTSTNVNYKEYSKNKGSHYKISVQPYSYQSELSPARSGKISLQDFNVRSPSPVILGSPENGQYFDGLSALRQPISLTWLSGEDKAEYSQLILRKILPSGNTKIVEKIENPGKTVSFERLTAGTYEWTVKASTSDGISLDAQDYKSFVVGKVAELDRPNLLEPENKLLMGPEYLKAHRVLTFAWDKVSGANDYVFVLYQKTPEGLKKIYSQDTGRSTSVKFRNLKILDVGEFEWQVIAYSYAKDGFEEQHSKVAVGNFSIEFNKPQKIKTKDPGRLYAE